MPEGVFPLPAPAAERAFQLQYGYNGMIMDALIASIRLLSHLVSTGLSAVKHSVTPGINTRDTSQQVGLAVLCTVLLTLAIFGPRRYIFIRSWISAAICLLYAAGLAVSFRPASCRYCPLLWTHRMLFLNVPVTITRHTAASYWWSNAVAWVILVVIQAADPEHNCGKDLACLASATAAVCSQPEELVQQLLLPATVAAAAAGLLDILLPGAVLTYLEYRARKRYWQEYQQQQQQQQLQQAQGVTSQAEKRQRGVAAEGPDIPAPVQCAMGQQPAGRLPVTGLTYVSPLYRQSVAVKIKAPASTDIAQLTYVRQQLLLSLQSAVNTPKAASATTPSAGHMSSSTGAVVAHVATFKGCYHVLFSVVAPAAQQQQQQQQQQLTEQRVQQLLQVQLQQLQDAEGWQLQVQVQQQQSAQAATPAAAPQSINCPCSAALPGPSLLAEGGPGASQNRPTWDMVGISLTHDMVQQLQQQGYDRVRVVLTPQSTSTVIADRSWPAQVLIQQQPGTTGSTPVAAVTPAAGEVAMQLSVDWHSALDSLGHCTGATQPQVHVLSIIVLAESQLRAVDITSAEAAAAGNNGTPHPDSLISLLLTQRPLLLLPAAAHEELQQLYKAGLQSGMQQQQAQQLLLALAQDLATVLLGESSSAAARLDVQLYQSVVDRLTDTFDRNGMTSCKELLPRHVNMQRDRQHFSGPVQTTAEVAAPAEEIDVAAAKHLLVTSGSGSSNMATAAGHVEDLPTTPRKPWIPHNHAGSTNSNVSGALAAAVELLSERGHDEQTLQLKWYTPFTGFDTQLPGVESSFASYRSVVLQRLDLYVFLFFAFIEIALLVRYIFLRAMAGSLHQVLFFESRLYIVLPSVLGQGLVWLAGASSSFAPLQQWRDTAQLASVVLQMVVVVSGLQSQQYQPVMSDVQEAFHSSPMLLMTYQYIVRPLSMCIGETSAVVYIIAHEMYYVVVATDLSKQTGLWGHISWQAVAMWGLCVAVCHKVQYNLRQAFINGVRQRYQQQQHNKQLHGLAGSSRHLKVS